DADLPRARDHQVTLRPGGRLHLHAGGGGPDLQGDARAGAADRGQGGAKITAPRAKPATGRLPRWDTPLTRHRRSERPGGFFITTELQPQRTQRAPRTQENKNLFFVVFLCVLCALCGCNTQETPAMTAPAEIL